MIFDPFGDFRERGYLRNFDGLHDSDAVREIEHSAFVDKLDEALHYLAGVPALGYSDVLKTHEILFADVYPWAGQDRAQLLPEKAITRGPVLFAHPEDARRAVDYALRLGNDPAAMSTRPGEAMGYLAYGHPFLDGNGRSFMVVHAELAERAGVSIEWGKTGKADYLRALTRELDEPGRHLDAYLRPFISGAVGRDILARHVVAVRGLDGSADQLREPPEVAGSFADAALQARYREQERQREDSRLSSYMDSLMQDVPEADMEPPGPERGPSKGRAR